MKEHGWALGGIEMMILKTDLKYQGEEHKHFNNSRVNAEWTNMSVTRH
jgi:hypothetical protein